MVTLTELLTTKIETKHLKATTQERCIFIDAIWESKEDTDFAAIKRVSLFVNNCPAIEKFRKSWSSVPLIEPISEEKGTKFLMNCSQTDTGKLILNIELRAVGNISRFKSESTIEARKAEIKGILDSLDVQLTVNSIIDNFIVNPAMKQLNDFENSQLDNYFNGQALNQANELLEETENKEWASLREQLKLVKEMELKIVTRQAELRKEALIDAYFSADALATAPEEQREIVNKRLINSEGIKDRRPLRR
ncbi:TPA: hypothetical protein I7730_16110 [Vibrio vulnificus]|uniref:Uncharacterized protein n=1 Tax=Vibrio vulnificus TaxID=672 RepID=A0A8H9N1Z0_VIBVL|nr:hypothetical protein [Vibrio vulnificus]HAS8541308.1 hypothetical protein [Vibrio vulnificus]